MRVAYVLLHFPFLTETFVAEEIRALRSEGVEVDIVSLLEPGRGPVQASSQPLVEHTWYAPGLASPGLWISQVIEAARAPGRYFAALFTLMGQSGPGGLSWLKRLAIFLKAAAAARALRPRGIDHIHAHFAWLPGAGAWAVARLLGGQYTVTVHAYDLFSKAELAPLVCGEAARVVAISGYNKDVVASLAPGARSEVIHCGLDRAGLEAAAGGSVATKSRSGVLRIVSVGSLVPKKGHAHLLEACGLLMQRGVDVHCTILGGGPEEESLRQIIAAHGLQQHVVLTGAVPQTQIAATYGQADVFVLACVVAPNGDRDGIPVALMEAAWFGLPLVSTRVSGIPELVRHEETGLLVEPEDPAGLSEALERLARQPDLGPRLGRAGRELVEAEFDVHRNAARLKQLFEQVASPRPQP